MILFHYSLNLYEVENASLSTYVCVGSTFQQLKSYLLGIPRKDKYSHYRINWKIIACHLLYLCITDILL